MCHVQGKTWMNEQMTKRGVLHKKEESLRGYMSMRVMWIICHGLLTPNIPCYETFFGVTCLLPSIIQTNSKETCSPSLQFQRLLRTRWIKAQPHPRRESLLSTPVTLRPRYADRKSSQRARECKNSVSFELLWQVLNAGGVVTVGKAFHVHFVRVR